MGKKRQLGNKGPLSNKGQLVKKSNDVFLKSRPKAGQLAYVFLIKESLIVKDSWAKRGSSVMKDSSKIKYSSSKKAVMFFLKSRPKAGKLAY